VHTITTFKNEAIKLAEDIGLTKAKDGALPSAS
jgi:hypothetical protein